jgi:hypothetical protein
MLLERFEQPPLIDSTEQSRLNPLMTLAFQGVVFHNPGYSKRSLLFCKPRLE